jgi:hypothetical protein
MSKIAKLRGWSAFAGLELLGQRGLLYHGSVYDNGDEWPAWIITDSSRRNAQARRIDGGLWQGIGGKKAKSLPGANGFWPIGAPSIGNRPFVLFCEGQPDFVASLFVAWWEQLDLELVAPVCMTGAKNPIDPDALPFFAGKRVRIAVHLDDAGREAGERWAFQLYAAGATLVDGFNFNGLTMPDGRPVEDLADFATLLDPDNSPLVRVLPSMPLNAPRASITMQA